MMRVINAADREVALAVERELPHIARAVDGIVDRDRSKAAAYSTRAPGRRDGWVCLTPRNVRPRLIHHLIWCKA